jgi:hypothetical protein
MQNIPLQKIPTLLFLIEYLSLSIALVALVPQDEKDGVRNLALITTTGFFLLCVDL